MTARRTPAPIRAIVALFKAVFLTVRVAFAFALGAAVLGGLPWALVRFAGWPLPHHMLSLSQLKTDLTSPILGDQFYLNAIAIVLWFLWSILAFSFLLELLYAIRRMPAPHVPGLGPAQLLAGFLITAIGITALLGRSAAPARADTSPVLAKARTVATAPATISTPSGLRSVSALPVRESVHHVVPGDSLYKIAEQDLGDGNDWPVLYEANASVVQHDGQKLTDPNLILPDWDITIPSATTDSMTAAPAPAAAPTTPEPAIHAPADPAPVAKTPSHVGPSPAHQAPTTPGTPAPSRPSPAVPTSATDHRTAPPSVRHAKQGAQHSGLWIELAAGGAIAASTALALGTAIARRRKLRDLAANPWWPKPGQIRVVEVPRMPPALRPARTVVLLPDEQLADATFEDAVGELDDFGAPTDVAATPTADRMPARTPRESEETAVQGPVQVAVSSAQEQRAPVGAVRIPLAVTIDGVPIALAELGGLGLSGPGALGAARATAAAVLATATPGTLGARLLIPAPDAALLLDARAEELPDLCGASGRLQLADDLASALATANMHAEQRARILAEAGVADLAELSDVYDEDHPEVVLLAVARGELDAAAATRLAEAAAVSVHTVLLGRHPVGTNWHVEADGDISSGADADTYAFDLSATALREAIAVLAGEDSTAAPEPVENAPDPHGALAEPAGYADDDPDEESEGGPMLQGPEADESSAFVEAEEPEDNARESNDAAAGVDEESAPQTTQTVLDVPDAEADIESVAAQTPALNVRPLIAAATPEPLEATAEVDPVGAILDAYLEAPVRIRILGRMMITTTSGPIASGMRTGAKRIAARLAVHYERGQSGEELAMLWPDLEPKKLAATRKSDLNSLRTNLQRDAAEYASYLPTIAGRYRLDPAAVGVDLACFTKLRALAARSTDPELRAAACQAALALYDGELLAGNDEEWTIGPRVQARREALATATLLAQLSDTAGRPEEALGWWERARCIDDNEEVYRQIMKAQARLGRRADVIATRDLLLAKLEPLEQDMAEATLDVLADILSERPSGNQAA